MRVLIDECIDERLRHEFPGHDCQTARHAGLAGLKNERLLLSAEAASFEVLVTVDQNISHQQNFIGRKIAIVILRAPTSRLEHLKQTVPAALAKLAVIRPGEVLIGS